MAHIPEEAHIVAYYLAKFPNSYINLEPNKNMTELLSNYTKYFCMADSSLKRLRDEYDAFFPHRAGYKEAEKRKSRKKTHDFLNNLSETDLHSKVIEILAGNPTELTESEQVYSNPLWEGQRVQVQINKYERNSYARRACIEYHGTTCKCCSHDLATIYGEIAQGVIEVHHLKPIAEIGKDYQIDPIKDLIPLCPNCHRVIHKRNPPFTIDELSTQIKKI